MDIYKYEDKVIVDDYAHHPTEIKSIFDTIDSNYQDKPKAVIFQPHLYTRTRDLMDDFAKVLSYFHEVYLLDIYPAREKPINGITSEVLLNKIDASKKEIVKKVEINDVINNTNCKIIAILGAGDLTVNLNKKYLLMNRFLTTIFMLSLISFMILLSSFIEYDNHESNTEYNVYYAFDNLYNNKPIIDSIMTNKSNIELIKANKLNEIESKLYEIESIHEANIFRDLNFNLSINIVEREPLAYYKKNDSYIDLSGKIIKKNNKLDDRLPILLGDTSKNNIKKVVDVIMAFNEDMFLNQKLEKLWFVKDELFLKLNNYQFDIRFGDNNKMNKKLEMLKGFCIYNWRIKEMKLINRSI